MADSEAQIKGAKKINEALLEVIVDLQKQEFTQDQNIIQSRAFNRLLKDGHQLLQSYEELLQKNHDLENKLSDFSEEHSKNLQKAKKSFDDHASIVQSQLNSNENRSNRER